MANIIIRIGSRDPVLRAWHTAVPELSSTSYNEIVKSVIRAEMSGKPFCAGRLHESRLRENNSGICGYNMYYNPVKDSDIQAWQESVKQKHILVASLLKAYMVRHIEVVPDNVPEYIPDLIDCINCTEQGQTQLTSHAEAAVPSTSQPVHTIQTEPIITKREVETEKPVVASSEAHTAVSTPKPDESSPSKKHGSFAGLGGARRRD